MSYIETCAAIAAKKPELAPIEARVGMEVYQNDANKSCFCSREKALIESISAESISLRYTDWDHSDDACVCKPEYGAWVRSFMDAPITITCAETGGPVVLPNMGNLADNLPTSEASCVKSAENDTREIEVGSQWRRNSGGKQCVVITTNPCDLEPYYELVYEGGNGDCATVIAGESYFCKHFTHLFTPDEDLNNVPDGAKIVGFDGEAVMKDDNPNFVRLVCVESGQAHSVNGLPSTVSTRSARHWERQGNWYREEGAAAEYADGRRVFALGRGIVAPEEWGRQIAAMGKADGVKEQYRHLLPEEERDTTKDDIREVTMPDGCREVPLDDAFAEPEAPGGVTTIANEVRAGSLPAALVSYEGVPWQWNGSTIENMDSQPDADADADESWREGGFRLYAPAFFDGQSKWVRFLPPESGVCDGE